MTSIERGGAWFTKRNLPFLIALTLVVGVITFIRFRFLNVPFERDEGEYAYAGMMLLKGYLPYEDFYNMKLPGTYLVYALFIKLFGHSIAAIHGGFIIATLVSAWCILQLGRLLSGMVGGVAAACAFLLFCISPELQGSSANAEHFVLPFALGGMLLAFRQRSFLLAGLLLGLAVLMKQHGVFFAAATGLFILQQSIVRNRHWWHKLRPALTYTLGAAAPLGLLMLFYAMRGSFSDFWFYTVEYANHYILLVEPEWGLDNLVSTGNRILRGHAWLLFIAAFGFVVCFFAKWKVRFFMSLLLLSSGAAVWIGLYYRPHYFVFLTPVVALFLGIGLQWLAGRPWRNVVWRWSTLVLLLVTIGTSLHWNRTFYFENTPNRVSRALYWHNPFPESVVIGAYLKRNRLPHHKLAVIGNEPQIAFYADMPSATGFMYLYSILEDHPYSWSMLDQLQDEVAGSLPEFLIYSSLHMRKDVTDRKQAIIEWYQELKQARYRQVGLIHLTGEWQPVGFWDDEAAELTPLADTDWIEVCRKR